MKILHVIFSFAPDGAETMLVDILNVQCKTDQVELMIINNIYNSELIRTIDKRVAIHYINRRQGSLNPLKIFLLNYQILQSNPHIIHFHNHNAIGLLIFKRSVKTCLTIHSVNKPIKYLSKYNKLFSISHAVKLDIEKRGRLTSKMVYNGIDFTKIKVKNNYTPDKVFKIAVVSRLSHEVKGQHIMLKALHHLIYSMGIDNVKVDFIGEGPSFEYLQKLTYALKIEKSVSFLGMKNRKYIYSNLRDYSLLVQPSIYEGFGLTVVEAIAAKVPVLVSNSDGPIEIICNGKYGFIFENGAPFSCAQAIKNIITNSDKIADKLDLARDYVISKFSIENTAKEYLNEYKCLISKLNS